MEDGMTEAALGLGKGLVHNCAGGPVHEDDFEILVHRHNRRGYLIQDPDGQIAVHHATLVDQVLIHKFASLWTWWEFPLNT